VVGRQSPPNGTPQSVDARVLSRTLARAGRAICDKLLDALMCAGQALSTVLGIADTMTSAEFVLSAPLRRDDGGHTDPDGGHCSVDGAGDRDSGWREGSSHGSVGSERTPCAVDSFRVMAMRRRATILVAPTPVETALEGTLAAALTPINEPRNAPGKSVLLSIRKRSAPPAEVEAMAIPIPLPHGPGRPCEKGDARRAGHTPFGGALSATSSVALGALLNGPLECCAALLDFVHERKVTIDVAAAFAPFDHQASTMG